MYVELKIGGVGQIYGSCSKWITDQAIKEVSRGAQVRKMSPDPQV